MTTSLPKKNKGFTLVETLVAVAILTVAITGAFTAAQNGISSATYSRDQVIAFYLAAEGVEEVRNMRDTNVLHGVDWMTNLTALASDPCYFGKVCAIDAVNVDVSGNPVITTCSGPGACPVLKVDPLSGFYGYTVSWTNTNFRREITLTSINSHEVSVGVAMSWTQGIFTRRFNVRENIYKLQ